MAIAAYASVISLCHVLDQIQHPSRLHLLPNKKKIETLHEKVHFLQEFLELHSQVECDQTKDLVRRIAEVAHEAEIIIDFHVVNQLHEGHYDYTDIERSYFESIPNQLLSMVRVEGKAENIIDFHVVNQLRGGNDDKGYIGLSSFSREIDEVIEKIESISKELLSMVRAEGKDVREKQLKIYVSSTLPSGGKSTVVGLDEHLVQIKDELTGDQPDLQIIPPIVGMGGIGKTTLARLAFEKIESISKELLSMVRAKGKAVREKLLKVSVSAGPSTLPSGGKSTVVGLDEHLVQIMDHLTGYQPDLQIIPIVGMGGIGKTTLARLAFENKLIMEHFDVRVWFTISQEYSIHDILIGILSDIGVSGDLKSETLAELGQRLHKQLFGRRYLIVMDDMWSTEAWDDFKLSFPNNGNKSRIIVTTRLSDVAASLSSCSPYLMNFLDEDKSWILFCEKAFAHKNCSPELEEPGKKIAKSCKGLPLAIVVIGGCLAKSDMTREYWEFVAENIKSYASLEKEEQCDKILALSYQHLPIHLKPCFLYMRVFSEDERVEIPKLINLWIAEGFVKPLKDKCLEDVAEEYLKDLIDRNLIMIHEKRSMRDNKTIIIHDYLRDLCIRESQKEHFFSVPKVLEIMSCRIKENTCFLCNGENILEKIHLGQVIRGSGSTSPFTTRVCVACRTKHPELTRLRFTNVKFRDSDGNDFENVLLPTTLRCLTLIDLNPPEFSFSSIHLHWNLQALTIYAEKLVIVPSEIWELSQIRHIEITRAILPGAHVNIDWAILQERKETILENLHTLSYIVDFNLTGEVLKRIPNIKKLWITDSADSLLTNLANLCKLEELVLEGCNTSSENIAFPQSLKKLDLSYCSMHWEDMTLIGSLPNLEALKLTENRHFIGSEWNPVEGEFLRLKYLFMKSLKLVWWRAEDVHFPCLETLVLRWVEYLEEIPSSIGDITTLSSMHLDYCSDKVNNSAKEIIEEQRNMGNDHLQLFIATTPRFA